MRMQAGTCLKQNKKVIKTNSNAAVGKLNVSFIPHLSSHS
jgi:hypothetical protein